MQCAYRLKQRELYHRRFMEETQKTTTDDAGGELEKLAAENEALRMEIRMRAAAYDVEVRLSAAGARTPGLLLKEARERFEFGEDGTLANAEVLIEDLQRAFPEQFGRDAAAAGSIDAAAGRNAAPPLTHKTLSKMSAAEIRGLDWEEVRAALTGQ